MLFNSENEGMTVLGAEEIDVQDFMMKTALALDYCCLSRGEVVSQEVLRRVVKDLFRG